jgi:hypothetical protein
LRPRLAVAEYRQAPSVLALVEDVEHVEDVPDAAYEAEHLADVDGVARPRVRPELAELRPLEGVEAAGGTRDLLKYRPSGRGRDTEERGELPHREVRAVVHRHQQYPIGQRKPPRPTPSAAPTTALPDRLQQPPELIHPKPGEHLHPHRLSFQHPTHTREIPDHSLLQHPLGRVSKAWTGRTM